MNETMNFQDKNKYRIGSITYEVNSCFKPDGENLREKVSRLIVEDVRKKTNGTVADRKAKL